MSTNPRRERTGNPVALWPLDASMEERLEHIARAFEADQRQKSTIMTRAFELFYKMLVPAVGLITIFVIGERDNRLQTDQILAGQIGTEREDRKREDTILAVSIAAERESRRNEIAEWRREQGKLADEFDRRNAAERQIIKEAGAIMDKRLAAMETTRFTREDALTLQQRIVELGNPQVQSILQQIGSITTALTRVEVELKHITEKSNK